MNFGAFATPERREIFDINDFDETLPAPWEWDIKRLVTSFLIASRSNGFSEADARKTALGCVRSYRERMIEFAQMRTLDVWYARWTWRRFFQRLKTMRPGNASSGDCRRPKRAMYSNRTFQNWSR